MAKEPKTIEVKISWDGKQMKIGIPAEFVEDLNIDPKKDTILWALIEDDHGTLLRAQLIRK